MRIKTILKKSSFVMIILCGMIIGSIGYSAINPIPPQQNLKQNANFPKNDSGETYGSALDASPYEKEPDLILAYTTDGKLGYVRSTDINEELPKSPEEALEKQTKSTNVREVPVYKSDGKTVIGKFEIQPVSAIKTTSTKAD